MFDGWADGGHKQRATLAGVEVWSDRGWTAVEHVIRHTTDKRVFRVSTPVGFVDCTEDHSLLNQLGQEVRPTDVVVGSMLLARPLPRLLPTQGFDGMGPPPEAVDVMVGLDRQAINEMAGHLEGGVWDVNGQGQLGLAKMVLMAQTVGMSVRFEPGGPGRYRVEAVGRSLLPEVVAVTELDRRPRTVYDLETANHHFAAGPGQLVVHNTDSVMVELLVDRELWASERPRPGDPGDERRLYPSPGIRQAFAMGEELETRLNRRIAEITGQGFLELEFEQLFDVSCFLCPKRYMGSRWTRVERSCGLYLKGVQSERRDASAPLRDALRDSMGALMFNEDPRPLARVEAALHAVQRALQRFLDGDVPFDDYIMTKSLRDHYKVPNAQGPHLTVVRKMRSRAPGSEPQPGNRVPYLICITGRVRDKVSEKAEDPDYAADNGLQPDRVFYAQRLLNPMRDMLDPLLPPGVTVDRVAAPYLDRMAAQDAGARPLMGPGPAPTVPLVRLTAARTAAQPAAQPAARRQLTIQFAPAPRDPRVTRVRPPPPGRPNKRKREPPHPKLWFPPANGEN